MTRHDDAEFPGYVTSRLAALPGVSAVALGGSRAAGTHGPDSDWDFAVYYRGRFDPADLRAVGWPGEVSDLGGWGGGVFNGGGWLRVDGRKVDVHYRDLDDVEHHLAEARQGRFAIENLLFYLAGVPTYVVVAELAGNRVLAGSLPRPEYPAALRESASAQWAARSRLTLDYARGAYAVHGRALACAGAVARAAAEAAHAVLAARGEWITNEKRLLDRAGLGDLDATVAGFSAEPAALTAAVDRVGDLIRDRLARGYRRVGRARTCIRSPCGPNRLRTSAGSGSGIAEPVRDVGVELGDLAGGQDEVVLAEQQAQPAGQHVEPLVALVHLLLRRARRPVSGGMICLYACSPPGRRVSGMYGHAVPGDRAGVHARVAGGRRVDQLVERHLVGAGQREQQLQGGPALPGLQPGQGADRDPGGRGQLGQGGAALLAQGAQPGAHRRQDGVERPSVCHSGNVTCQSSSARIVASRRKEYAAWTRHTTWWWSAAARPG